MSKRKISTFSILSDGTVYNKGLAKAVAEQLREIYEMYFPGADFTVAKEKR